MKFSSHPIPFRPDDFVHVFGKFGEFKVCTHRHQTKDGVIQYALWNAEQGFLIEREENMVPAE